MLGSLARKTLGRELVIEGCNDVDELGLHSEWVMFRDMWRGRLSSLMSGQKQTFLK